MGYIRTFGDGGTHGIVLHSLLIWVISVVWYGVDGVAVARLWKEEVGIQRGMFNELHASYQSSSCRERKNLRREGPKHSPPILERNKPGLCQIQHLNSTLAPFTSLLALAYKPCLTICCLLRTIDIYIGPCADYTLSQNNRAFLLFSCLPCCWR